MKYQASQITKKHSRKVLFSATVDGHILSFHTPYLKMLQDMGYETHVATNGKADIPYCDVRYTVPFARSPFSLDNIKAIKQLKRIIETERFDLIHTHTPMGAVVTRLAAMRARKLYGTRVVYTAHGFHFYKGAPWHYWAMFYPIEKLLARVTDVLIAINREDYNLAERKFKTRVEYVPGVGVDPRKFDFKFTKANKTKLRQSLGLKDSDFVMIYPAELSKRKNQTMLIEAMEILIKKSPDIHLLLPGRDSLQGYHAKLIAEKGLERNIHLLGYRTDIPKLLKLADLSVSTSYQEGLPVHIIEAMTVGLPIISTRCRGAEELIAEEKNGYLVDCDDIERVADRIMAIMSTKESISRLGGESFRLAHRYGIDIIVGRMRNLYGAYLND